MPDAVLPEGMTAIKRAELPKFPDSPLVSNADVATIKKFLKDTTVRDFLSRRAKLEWGDGQCGQTALVWLTGNSIDRVKYELPDKHITDEQMVEYLRKREFVVTELIPQILQPEANALFDMIKSQHVVLLRVNVGGDESTWITLWDDVWFHNGAGYKADSTTFVNMDIIKKYLIYHPKRWTRATNQSVWMHRLRAVNEIDRRIIVADDNEPIEETSEE